MPDARIVLIERKNPPYGWALPGGFVDYGESCEQAAIREAHEETSLHVCLERQLGMYSDPERDPRQHTATTVFVARPEGDEQPLAGDDATNCRCFLPEEIPWDQLCFDHGKILRDYLEGGGPSVEGGLIVE
jgi:ADP-ribose pyrophosphatase YjhB (NUDIX family)